MYIVLASKSEVKINAVKSAFSECADVELTAVKVFSGVSEQPSGSETLTGAFNRLERVRQMFPQADLYLSIENGLFYEGGEYVDRAVVVTSRRAEPMKAYTSMVSFSDGVVFPAQWVAEAQSRGFDQWTVGKVMEENNVVAKHDDPHLDLSGKSRVAYIDDALRAVVKNLGLA